MFVTNIKFRRLAFGSALLCICGALWFWPGRSPRVEAEQPAGAASPAQPDKKDGKLKELLKERLAVVREVSAQIKAEYVTGKASFDRVQQAARALLDAELELCETDKERIAMLEKMVTLAKHSETTAGQRYKAGAAPHSDELMATAGRLEIEIALERAKSKAAARPK